MPKADTSSIQIRGGQPGVAGAAPQHLTGRKVYSCTTCRSHTADHEEIISKAFTGRHGRAFLVARAVNVQCAKPEDRNLMTGLHTVSDVHCACCNEVLGWRYEMAYDPSQKYKEGKFILEKTKIMKEGSW
ncbi:unnamed protein product [Pedinophyceae sp. YPF-701]|nr:unnamed protein product [Pedinophyceae sp. YPF-701]